MVSNNLGSIYSRLSSLRLIVHLVFVAARCAYCICGAPGGAPGFGNDYGKRNLIFYVQGRISCCHAVVGLETSIFSDTSYAITWSRMDANASNSQLESC